MKMSFKIICYLGQIVHEVILKKSRVNRVNDDDFVYLFDHMAKILTFPAILAIVKPYLLL